MCIMNCCQVINNLLLNASESLHHSPAGADEFLPVLIYLTIKANPPQLHSNLKYVQLFRRETKLVSEIEYYLTNLISAKTFILNINMHSLSMEEAEFEKHMRDAKLAIEQSTTDGGPHSADRDGAAGSKRKGKEIIKEEFRFPFMDANPGELTREDVNQLLGTYKQLVNRYTSVSAALKRLSIDEDRLLSMGDPPVSR
ncbi:vacuolar protein sorting-associated protein 9A-like isoform X2 [Carex littledalei]|uniref:Vacuolar protein sorting-associated protein 9A-like isoform X2 n=1 Tax=Carex littledalei TaxID=544730 RepID=A0A833VLE4_9POAL|nr:vacuolar protein sorting-associated protein 9A-like isoform X2 [Carex littledalei]